MLASRVAAAAALTLLMVAPAPAQVVAAPPVQVINLQSYAYRPTPIVLQAGRAVTLHFVNRSGNGHDFTAKRFVASARILSGRVYGGEVDLRPGRSASVTLIPAPGRYPVHCGHAFHKMLGMSSTIIVQ